MNWDAIGAVGEVLGAIGVIATLGYLAVQIRQNTTQLLESQKIAQVGAMEATAQSVNDMRELMLVHPPLLDLFLRGSASYSALEPADRLRFEWLMRNAFNTQQVAYVRFLSFRHDTAEYAGARQGLAAFLRMPGIRECLDQTEFDWRPEFREWIDSILAEIDAGAPQPSTE